MKPNLITRIVSVFLVPCLLIQPVLASIAAVPLYNVKIGCETASIGTSSFNEQAVIARLSGARFLSDRLQISQFVEAVRRYLILTFKTPKVFLSASVDRNLDSSEGRYLSTWGVFFHATSRRQKPKPLSLLVRGGVHHIVYLCPFATRTGGVQTHQRDVIETLLRCNEGVTIDLLYLRARDKAPSDPIRGPGQRQRIGSARTAGSIAPGGRLGTLACRARRPRQAGAAAHPGGNAH